MADYIKLKHELDSNSDSLSGMTHVEKANWFNTHMVTRLKSNFITERSLMALFGLNAASNIMDSLYELGNSVPRLKRLYDILHSVGTDQGIDIGLEMSRGAIPDLVTIGVINQTQADAILALGVETVTYGESVGLGFVLPGHIAKAMEIN